MTNLAQRAITGIILAAVIISSILLGRLSFVLLMLSINILGLIEFYRLFKSYTGSPRNTMGIFLSISLLTGFALVIFRVSDWKILLMNIPVVFGIFIVELFLEAKSPFQNLALTFLGLIGITVPIAFFLTLAVPTHPGNYPGLVLGYFFILWANDSGAYFAGKYLGKRPLFLRISPHKTWEGSIGGACCALLITSIFPGLLAPIPFAVWFGMALVIIITGTFGDLIKSLMKRSLQIKDSGTILPGHGGILDRFDTLLGSAPFVFVYLLAFHYL